jgi:hypothetical protein
MSVNRRCILAVAHGEKYRRQAVLMARSFLGRNPGWDFVCYSDGAPLDFPWWTESREIASLFDGYPPLATLPPWDQCEVGRFIAIAKLLAEYDVVLYCDNDLYWYAPYIYDARYSLILSPHFLDHATAIHHGGLLDRDGVFNIGVMHFATPLAACVCERIVSAVVAAPQENRHNGKLWLQNLLNPVAFWGLAFAMNPDIGCNVGYWNLRRGDREVLERDDAFLVRSHGVEAPLVAFHFSGKSLSHVMAGDCGDAPAKLAKAYLTELSRVKNRR